MVVIFKDTFGNDKPVKANVLKETKQYYYIQLTTGHKTKYRCNKETREVQDNTYHNVIKGLRFEE